MSRGAVWGMDSRSRFGLPGETWGGGGYSGGMDDQTRAVHERWLLDVTGLPTAAGCEQHVIGWVEDWVARRKNVTMRVDRYGNRLLAVRGREKSGRAAKPILFTAHLDHPAFVVREVLDDRQVRADFRGGVADEYFEGSAVCWHAPDRSATMTGKVERLEKSRDAKGDAQVLIRWSRRCDAISVGDIVTWKIGMPVIRRGRLHAPACDDLAGFSAGLAAFDVLRRKRSGGDVRLLLTRSEEVGFIGAIGACKNGLIPKLARVINLENSKSFAESPIGAGPIVRVGDRTSTFDPAMLLRMSQIAEQLQTHDKTFRFQRKLMAGGTCEASAFAAYGFQAACMCLPLGNYHNMNEDKGKIDAEVIAMSDFHQLVDLLVAMGTGFDEPTGHGGKGKGGAGGAGGNLRSRLDGLFESRRELLG